MENSVVFMQSVFRIRGLGQTGSLSPPRTKIIDLLIYLFSFR